MDLLAIVKLSLDRAVFGLVNPDNLFAITGIVIARPLFDHVTLPLATRLIAQPLIVKLLDLGGE